MAVSPEVKLSLFNRALQHLGSRKLASLTENRKPRRVLDDVWGNGNAFVNRALEQGEWNFATRAARIDYTPSIEPDFGFNRVFERPSDFRRLVTLSADEYFSAPLTHDQYNDEAGYWFSGLDVMYVKYVSDDDAYGMDASLWSETFKKYLEYDLAHEACEPITNSTAKQDRLGFMRDKQLVKATSLDNMNDGVKFPPSGSWVRSRSGSFNSRDKLR